MPLGAEKAVRVDMRTKLTADEWQAISKRWKSLNECIQTLIRLRDELDRWIGCGCLSQTNYPLHNPHDAIVKQGARLQTLTGD